MRRLLGSLIKTTGALVLAASVVGVLIGVERLLTRRARREPEADRPKLLPKPLQLCSSSPSSQRPFSIRRTKSEVGYVYWILKGYGEHKCFVLCDTWQEAVEQAKIRLEAATSAAGSRSLSASS
jgi:hypothetical protein